MKEKEETNLADFYEINLWIFPCPQTNHDLAWLRLRGERKSDIMPLNVNMANLARHGLTSYRVTDIRQDSAPLSPLYLY